MWSKQWEFYGLSDRRETQMFEWQFLNVGLNRERCTQQAEAAARDSLCP